MRTFIKILLPLLLLAQQLFAQDTILISDPATKGYLGKQVYTFQDKEGQLLVADLIKAPQLFTKSDNAVINFGVSNYTNWVRFYLKNASDHDKLFLNISYPVIDSVCLYTLTATGVDSIRIRDNGSLNNRKYKHPFYIFELRIPKGTTVTCFLELKSNKQIIVPIEVQNTEHIASSLTNSDSVSWLYFGIMLAMILYNLFVYFSSKDRHYLYYCNYIFWVLLTQFTLLGFLHRIPILDNVSFTPGILTFAGALSGIATVVFAKSFLYVKQNIPKYVLVLNCIILGDVLAIVMLLAGNPILAYNIVNATAGIGSLIVLFVALKVYLKKYKPARYFLFGQVFFLGGVIIFVLKDVGVLPYTIFTIRAVQIGSVIEAMLLSFALADKLNILKKEKELSQANALMIAKENERIIREQNINLEIKVNERTLELKESNNELNRTLDDLKQAQTQLVESEKMASLGQLTAGIAHEINNPINFVTSNVTPLKRDVDMLFDVINTIEEVGMSALSPEEKHRKIEAYKEEQDYDYLKVEINHLLKGIYEGASRTAEIVKGLRIFSRVDEDDLKKADVNEGIDSTIVIINNMLNNRIEIIRNYGTLPLIECYPGKLNQVFLNIISNAIHAVGKHFGEQVGGEIIISTTTDGKDVFIRIKDNGIGMDDKTRSKIFEPFFTTKDVGEGTGLGMSIAYNTIKKHNGTIHVESQPGKGAEFIIRLPVIFEVPAIA